MQKWSNTTFDLTKVREALAKALADGKCPISGDRDWTIVPEYVELRPFLGFSAASAPITSGRIGIFGTQADPSTGTIYGISPLGGGTGGGWQTPSEHTYPAVMATCKRCGYIALFNAVVLGLLPSGDQSVEDWRPSAGKPSND